MNGLILLNKDEAAYLSEKMPNLNIVRTVKHRSERHRYYCEESDKAKALINSLRCGVDKLEEGVAK